MAYLIDVAARAFPDARFVHIVRDGRDAVCSLLERGWLSAGRQGADDAGLAYGGDARFWVEPARADEFSRVGNARRAAWAWRRYVESARAAAADVFELRYERLAADPDAAAVDLAAYLGAPTLPLAEALRAVHATSVGRYRRDLSEEQLAEIVGEAGGLLRELGYPTD
jgi:hypothetical protein